MAHLLDVREVVPVRAYESFASDVKKKFAD